MSYFEHKRILITGAGTGLGALLAQRLAQAGATVIVTARRLEAATEVANSIRLNGGIADAEVLDVADVEAIPAFRDRLHQQYGPLDGLINNAGVVFGGEFEQVPLARHLDTFTTNTLGLMALCHSFLPDLQQARQGHLVNIASASAYIGLPYGSTYAASKWAVLGFSESLRLEMAERGFHNVAVTTVCPSYISTGMFDGVRSPFLSRMLSPEKVVQQTLRAMRRREAVVVAPASVRTIDLMKGALPRPLWDQLARRTGITGSMKSWRGKA